MAVFFFIMSGVFGIAAVSLTTGSHYAGAVWSAFPVNTEQLVFGGVCALLCAINLIAAFLVNHFDRILRLLMSRSPDTDQDEKSTGDFMPLIADEPLLHDSVQHSQPEKTTGTMFHVRKSWDEPGSQIGVFSVFSYAEEMLQSHPGYSVFDENGDRIFPPPDPGESDSQSIGKKL